MLRLALVLVASIVVVATEAVDIAVKARAVQPGEVVLVDIGGAAAQPPPRVRAFDREVAAYQDGDHWRAIIGIDLDVTPGVYRITVEPGGASYDLHVLPKRFRTRRLRVDEAFVTPPHSEEPRIAEEAALLAATWQSSSPTRLWAGPFIRPVAEPANSAFGTRSIFNGQPRNPHGGADFLSGSGTPVHAPNAGRIVIARSLYYSGNTVVIDRGLGLFSMLAHLSRIDVREGEIAPAGRIVGLVGATGRVTGPHLHWAVRAGEARVDPLSLLSVLGGKGISRNAHVERSVVVDMKKR